MSGWWLDRRGGFIGWGLVVAVVGWRDGWSVLDGYEGIDLILRGSGASM